MRTVSNFIFESSLKDKKKELLSYFKDKSYPEYVKTLDEMCKDPKSKALLDDGFGGELGDLELDMTFSNIPVQVLMPTQNEIDIDKSLMRYCKENDRVDLLFSKPVRLNFPLVTFNGTWIIDGHHRWSQVVCFNPDAIMECINFSASASPIQILKAVQGVIAAEEGDVPSQKVEGKNIYDMSEKDIKKYFEKNFTDESFNKFKDYLTIKDKKEMIEYFSNNTIQMIYDHPLLQYAPDRDYMPQTDKSDTALKVLADKKVLRVPGNK